MTGVMVVGALGVNTRVKEIFLSVGDDRKKLVVVRPIYSIKKKKKKKNLNTHHFVVTDAVGENIFKKKIISRAPVE